MTTAHTNVPAPQRVSVNRPRPSGANPPAPTLDPFQVVRKHLTALIASTVVGLVFGVGLWAVLWFTYPLYTASEKFEIVAPMTSAGDVLPNELDRDEVVVRTARTEMSYLMQREVLSRAMTSPDVQNTSWAEYFKDDQGQFLLEDAVDELEEDLVVRYINDTNLFEVQWSMHEKLDIPIVLSAIRIEYLQYRDEIDDRQFDEDLDAFSDQEVSINGDIERLNTQIQFFVSTNKIFTLEDIRSHPVALEVHTITSEIGQAQSNLSILQSQRSMIAAKLEGDLEPTHEDRLVAEQDQTVFQIAVAISQLRIERRRQAQKFGTDHMSVREIELRVRAAEEEYEDRLDEIMQRNLEGSFKALGNQIESLRGLLETQDARLIEKDAEFGQLSSQVAEYESLVRRRDDLHAELSTVRELQKELQLVRVRTAADRVRLADPADTPREMSFPLPEIMIPLGFLLVVGLTLAVVFIRELTDKRVKSAADLGIVPGARVLGVIPDLQEDPTRINRAELAVREEPRSVIAESYRQSCTPILKDMERSGHRTLVVAGGLPGAGTTTVVSNLAAFLAAGGKNVLCIDANFRRPGLAAAMDCDNVDGPGLGDILTEQAYVSDVIQSCGSGIHVIGAGTPANRVFERLPNGQLDTMLSELRSQYDYILIDAPPAVVAGDALVLANKVDASILVVRANQEHRGLVARLINQLHDTNSEFIGIILNRPRWTAGGYFKKNFATMAEYAQQASSV